MTRLPDMAIHFRVACARKGCSYCTRVLCKKQAQLAVLDGERHQYHSATLLQKASGYPGSVSADDVGLHAREKQCTNGVAEYWFIAPLFNRWTV